MDQHHQTDNTPCARLCHIIKWDDFDGYGFNLHAEKGRHGQFIGKVDEGSPSEAAGLRQGDRIIEVNEINIANESHKQVVERIKAFANETKLLVVDQAADDYYKMNNIPIKGSMPGIRVLKTPEKSPAQLLQEERDAALAAAAAAAQKAAKQHTNGSVDHQTSINNETNPTMDNTETDSTSDRLNNHENGKKNSMSLTDEDATSIKSSTSSNSKVEQNQQSNGNNSINSVSSGTLNLTMSAKELRAKLAQRKKYDPKKESLNFKDKFDIVQKL